MLSDDLTRLGKGLEGIRETDGGLILSTKDVDLILCTVYQAAEDAEGLEGARAGAAERSSAEPPRNRVVGAERVEALRRLAATRPPPKPTTAVLESRGDKA